MPLQLTIDDTSPTVSYLPFRDTLSTPNLSAGWNPYFSGFASAQGQLGNGTSYHITSKNGASLSLTWQGNGIQLFGNTTQSSFSIILDGSVYHLNDTAPTSPSNPDGALVDISGLDETAHTIILTAEIQQTVNPSDSSMLVFDKAVIRTGNDSVTLSPQFIDNNNIAFLGRWSFEPVVPGMSFHVSNTTGDRVTTKFNGTAFLLLGMTEPDAGNYSVTLDGTTTILSAQSSFLVPNTTLFFATGLNSSTEHSVEVKNSGGKLSILENGFETFVTLQQAPPAPASENMSQSRSYPSGTIAAFGLAGILFFVLVTTALYVFVWRPRRRRSSFTGSLDKKFRFPSNLRSGQRKGSIWANKPKGKQGFNDRTKDMKAPLEEEDCLEISAHISGRSQSTTGFGRWQHEAGETSLHSMPLPMHFQRGDSEEGAASPKSESTDARHPYVRYSYELSKWPGDKSAETEKSVGHSDAEDRDLASVALANLRNKGKARQITGADSTTREDAPSRNNSPLPSLLQGLHVKITSSKNWPKLRTPRDSLSLSLNAPPSPALGAPRNIKNSDPERVSPFFAAENPSPEVRAWEQPQQPPYPVTTIVTMRSPSPLPSVPRSVSDDNSNRKVSTSSHQRDSRLLLLEEEGVDAAMIARHSYDGEMEYPLSPPPHTHTRRNQGNVGADQDQSLTEMISSQVIRSLSPRTSERTGSGGGIRTSRLGMGLFPSEGIDDQFSALDEKSPSTESDHDRPSSLQFARDVSPLVFVNPNKVASSREPTPDFGPSILQATNDNSNGDDDLPPKGGGGGGGLTVPKKSGSPILPSLKRSSPFDIKFDWSAAGIFGQGKSGSDGEDPAVSRKASQQSRRSKKSMKKQSQSEIRRHPSREGTFGGGGRSRFRLTPSTFTQPFQRPSSHQSQVTTSDIVTSFLDFTSSSEGSSHRSKSLRTVQSDERTFGDPMHQLPIFDLLGSPHGSQEPRSRWSDTTIPSISTRPRLSQRDIILPSRETSSSSGEKSNSNHAAVPAAGSTSSSTEIHPNLSPQPRNNDAQRQSTMTSGTQFSSENPVHTHPSIILTDYESQTDSNGSNRRRHSDLAFRHSESEESSGSGSSSRRTTDSSSNAFHTRLVLASRYPPLPEGTEDVASTGSK